MASLFKPIIISYRDPDGHKCSMEEATVPGPDGKRVLRKSEGFRRLKTKSKKWYARIKGPDGKARPVPLDEDKDVANDLMHKLGTEASRERHGLTDRYKVH